MLYGLKFAVMIAAAILVLGYVVMYLWNALMPDLLGAAEITIWQAYGVL